MLLDIIAQILLLHIWSCIYAGEVAVDVAERTVTLSKIFKWFSMDFGSKTGLLTWLLDYLPEGSARDLKTLLEKGDVDSIKLSFKDYDWSLNSS